ncbi:MAG: hypothetical protein KGK18_21465 [Burkholderiales bacterium]|nr:hypothetical protein [Burkholderiales bacterium]
MATSPDRRRGATLEHAEAAARLLAVGEGTIKSRLLAAYTDQLQHVVQAEVPAELVQRLVSIRRRLGATGGRDSQSPVKSAMDRMTVADAVKIAADIFDFHVALSCALHH